MDIRIGQGYDVHQPVEDRDLMLDGMHIPFEKDLLDHSDADTLLRALTDALLGAAGLGDIGSHFPDTAAEFKDADNHVLPREAYQSVQALSWRIANINTTITAQKPKLASYIPVMRASITTNLGIQAACVNIRGKTNEELGYLGRMEAIETQAMVLLRKADIPRLAV